MTADTDCARASLGARIRGSHAIRLKTKAMRANCIMRRTAFNATPDNEGFIKLPFIGAATSPVVRS